MTNNRIQTTELDFDLIKDNLKNYLKGQEQFSDYDFEGSGLSVLLDVLAYNTHYNALYTNLAVNEAFLDSASKRSSVVSKAKELGYIPQSSKSSTAVVSITLINDQLTAPSYIEIPAYTSLSASVNGKTMTFYTIESQIALRDGNQYVFPSVTIKEGTYLQYRQVIQDSNTVNIPNPGVDLSTVKVFVQNSVQSATSTPYTANQNVLDATGTSEIYFVKENEDQTYTLEFGNGIVGKALSNGNVVTISYIVCHQDEPNGAKTFSYSGTLPSQTEAYVTTISPAAGGASAEGIDSIKWNAPRAYAAQNRCVTAEDYRTIISTMYPGIKSINVWGGEENTPPEYGKVFISIVPNDNSFLTEAQKSTIRTEIINPRKALAITPVFTDPIYLKIEVEVSFYYNPVNTTRNAGDLYTIVQQTINNYNDSALSSFGGVFKYSQLSGLIDASEKSITSNIMNIKLHRDVTPVFNVTTGYAINIGNPIFNSGVPETSVLSTGFYTADSLEVCYIDDVPTNVDTDIGTLRIFYVDASGSKIKLRDTGTVNYATGQIKINNLNITMLYATSWSLTIKPQSNDVVSVQNQFVEIDPALISITPVIDTPSQTYTFTSSRN